MSKTRIVKFSAEALFGELGDGVPAPAPIGDMVSRIRAK